MASFFITGSSRDFGLALARELASRPASEVSKIIASSRGESPALQELAKNSPDRVALVKLDVTNEESIKKAASEVEAELGGKGLDVLINNAGVCQYVSDGVKSMDNLQESFTINVMGVHWVTRAFLPLLQRGNLKKVANIPANPWTSSLGSDQTQPTSTTLGSIALAPTLHHLPAPAYNISKVAMNALTVQYALDFEKEGFSFMALCPGWMKTDLGGGDMADLTPEQGAKASIEVIYRPNKETNGQMPKVFVKGWENAKGPNVYDGTNVPW